MQIKSVDHWEGVSTPENPASLKGLQVRTKEEMIDLLSYPSGIAGIMRMRCFGLWNKDAAILNFLNFPKFEKRKNIVISVTRTTVTYTQFVGNCLSTSKCNYVAHGCGCRLQRSGESYSYSP